MTPRPKGHDRTWCSLPLQAGNAARPMLVGSVGALAQIGHLLRQIVVLRFVFAAHLVVEHGHANLGGILVGIQPGAGVGLEESPVPVGAGVRGDPGEGDGVLVEASEQDESVGLPIERMKGKDSLQGSELTSNQGGANELPGISWTLNLNSLGPMRADELNKPLRPLSGDFLAIAVVHAGPTVERAAAQPMCRYDGLTFPFLLLCTDGKKKIIGKKVCYCDLYDERK